MKPLEIYIHIPFCAKKCNYCDFLSGPAPKEERRAYVESLCRRIRSCGNLAKAYRVISIFVGGGTPSILEGEQMGQIFAAARQAFFIDENAEITVEVNPGTVTEEKLKMYRETGVNRLSIGLQSASDEELKILGRIHSFRDFLETYRMAREEGFGNINVDLISAVPGQTRESWAQTLERTAALCPEHISAYSLIIEEGTPFYEIYSSENSGSRKKGEGNPPLPDEDEERQMYQDTKDILAQYGYERYEISNYARKGYECRHNLGYWNRTEYLGIGTGASSFMEHKRWVQDEKPHELSMSEEMEEYMFLGLRKTKGVSEKRFEEEFTAPIEEIYGAVINDMISKGLMVRNDDFIMLTDRGTDVSNYVMSMFLLD
ncbi:MAG: radical SAM family heme chaperone HemW [Dorea sp.]|nr:radical SAM family heme chaperone HemW [Dorea sp.]